MELEKKEKNTAICHGRVKVTRSRERPCDDSVCRKIYSNRGSILFVFRASNAKTHAVFVSEREVEASALFAFVQTLQSVWSMCGPLFKHCGLGRGVGILRRLLFL